MIELFYEKIYGGELSMIKLYNSWTRVFMVFSTAVGV